MSAQFLSQEKLKAFPNLTQGEYFVSSNDTSNAPIKYNCIAHAVGDNQQWWWPDHLGMVGYKVYWPSGVSCEVTLEAFIDAFKTKDFMPCEEMNTDLEPGYQKAVLYVDQDTNEPTHAALQLASGAWTSKLGDWEDIEHASLSGLECSAYGKIAKVLKRRVDQVSGGGRESAEKAQDKVGGTSTAHV
jgi:hypothetical protein